MAGILDRCVPSRRLERRRQRALHENLDARFGDSHITAPTEGAWNQIGTDAGREYLPGSVTSGGWSPEIPSCEPTPVSRLSMDNIVEDGSYDKDSQKHNFTITIPLPWPSRKSHTRASSITNNAERNSSKKEEQGELSPRSLMSSPEPTPSSFVSSPDSNTKSYISSPNTTLPSQATSPVVIYKPASEEYKQQLAEMAGGITRIASSSSLPPERNQNTSPIIVTYKPTSEDFAKEMAEVGMGLSPVIPQRETFSRPRAPSRSTQTGLPLDPRPTPVYAPEPQVTLTEMSENAETTRRIRSPDLSLGLPAEPRIGTTRSASRGPAADRTDTTRSVSQGPASGPTRSSSRGPTTERKGSVHSSSRPSLDHHANRRSASRGPLKERSGNALHGRSASCVPTSTRTPYRGSVSSDSSAGSSITASSSTTLNDSIIINPTTNTNRLTRAERNQERSVGSATGYYSTVTKEYRRIASDVEDREYEKRKQQEIEDDRRRRRKDKGSQGSQGPQVMVPDADELW